MGLPFKASFKFATKRLRDWTAALALACAAVGVVSGLEWSGELPGVAPARGSPLGQQQTAQAEASRLATVAQEARKRSDAAYEVASSADKAVVERRGGWERRQAARKELGQVAPREEEQAVNGELAKLAARKDKAQEAEQELSERASLAARSANDYSRAMGEAQLHAEVVGALWAASCALVLALGGLWAALGGGKRKAWLAKGLGLGAAAIAVLDAAPLAALGMLREPAELYFHSSLGQQVAGRLVWLPSMIDCVSVGCYGLGVAIAAQGARDLSRDKAGMDKKWSIGVMKIVAGSMLIALPVFLQTSVETMWGTGVVVARM